MTRFVHLDYSSQHAGVARIEAVISSAKRIKRNFSTARFLATLLLSAIAAAVMVVAHQVMDSLTDGHLVVLWVAMWAVAFAALATFASAARQAAVSAKIRLDNWSRNMAAKRADERLWAMAKTDKRLMADLQAMTARNDAGDDGLRFVMPAPVVDKIASRPVLLRGDLMPAYHRPYV